MDGDDLLKPTKVKIKVKFTVEQATRAQRGSRCSGVPRGVWGVQPPPRNSEILTKYQKLRKFYYMK
jgi:hypothetical protein